MAKKKRTETQKSAEKRTRKRRTTAEETPEEIDISAEETAEDNAEINEGGTDDTDNGFSASQEREVGLTPEPLDVMFDIKQQLQESGININGELKFIISKKEEKTGKYSHVKTFSGEMPELDAVGDLCGGGDFQVKVVGKTGEGHSGYIGTKMFSISKESFPFPKPKTTEANNPAQPTQTIIQAPSNTGMEVFLAKVMEQNNNMLNIMLTRKEDKKENILDTIKVLKELMPEPQKPQQLPIADMMAMMGMMFKEGINLKTRLEDTDKDEDIGDVLIGMVKDFGKNLPEMMANMQNAQRQIADAQGGGSGVQPKQVVSGKPAVAKNPSAPALTPAPTMSPEQANKLLMDTLRDFLDEVVVGFESELEVNPYIHAEKCFRIKRFKVIATIIGMNTDEAIIKELSARGMAKLFEQEGFKEYFLAVVDIIRNFDIITLDDDGSAVKAEKPAAESEVAADASSEEVPDNADDTEQSGNAEEPAKE